MGVKNMIAVEHKFLSNNNTPPYLATEDVRDASNNSKTSSMASVGCRFGAFFEGLIGDEWLSVPCIASSGPYLMRASVVPGPFHVNASNLTQNIVRKWLAQNGVSFAMAGRADVLSSVPHQRELGQASGEATAIILALARFHGVSVDPLQIHSLVSAHMQAEPLHLPGQLVILNRASQSIEITGAMPALLIIELDRRCTANTPSLEYTTYKRLDRFQDDYSNLLDLVRKNQVDKLLYASTISATIHFHEVLEEKCAVFPRAVQLSQDYGGGVVRAYQDGTLGVALPIETRSRDVLQVIARLQDSGYSTQIWQTGVSVS